MFWLNYFIAKLNKLQGVAEKDIGLGNVTWEQVQFAIDNVAGVHSKKYDFYSHTFPKLKDMYCFYDLCFHNSIDDMMYDSIGFVYPEDKVTLHKIIKSDGSIYSSVRVKINNIWLFKLVLNFYRTHPTMPNVVYRMQHDLNIVQEYMDFSAEMAAETISKNVVFINNFE